MQIVIGSDHAGYPLKGHLIRHLEAGGHEVTDLGTDSGDPVDYPPICAAVARRVVEATAEGIPARGVVLGGSGQGEQIAANKIRGIRAALCNGVVTARLAREHNDANVIAIGARLVAPELAAEILDVFLSTEFAGGRHARRVQQVTDLERGHDHHHTFLD
jgi:ribose 5-phosphate isomerase B